MRASLFVAAIAPFAFALPAALESRAVGAQAQAIVSSITVIQNNIATLTASLNKFNKGDLTILGEALGIQGQTLDLGKSVDNTTSIVQASKQLSLDDSGTVAVAVLNLQQKIQPLLNLIVSKKPAFDAVVLGVGSLSPQVKYDLQQQKAKSDALGAALIKKLDPVYAGIAPSIISQLDASFDKAIAAFAKSGGVFALPPIPDFPSFKLALGVAAGVSL